MDDFTFIKIGPAGGGVITHESDSDDDGSELRGAWDEKGRTLISQIYVWHGKQGINSIQFQYCADLFNLTNHLVMSDRHGTANGTKFDVVKLRVPKESITWIGGHTNSDNILCSITFGTNESQYGPFGRKPSNGEEFNFQVGQQNEFAGFYGAVDKNVVTAIGFYLNTFATT